MGLLNVKEPCENEERRTEQNNHQTPGASQKTQGSMWVSESSAEEQAAQWGAEGMGQRESAFPRAKENSKNFKLCVRCKINGGGREGPDL